MDEQTSKLFKGLVYTAPIIVEQEYRQLAVFNNVVLAVKENPISCSGFSFLILEKDDLENVIFRNGSEEFQNANIIFLLRAMLNLKFEGGDRSSQN